MTTPATLNAIVQRIQKEYDDAEKAAHESAKQDPTSYAAGYDRGFSDALASVLIDIRGD